MASLTQDQDSTLISKLETSTSPPILSLFTAHLRPFTDLTQPPPQSEAQTLALTRSIAKRFLPFLNNSLSVLPRRLSSLSKSRPAEDAVPEFVIELFDVYRLCLDCLELLIPQLSCKRYTAQWQRVRLVRSLEAWGLYEEAEREGFRVLKRLRGLDLGVTDNKEKNKKKKKKEEKAAAEFVPELVDDVDAELANLVAEAVVLIVKCLALRKSVDGADYKRVLQLLKEVTHWFTCGLMRLIQYLRVLDANMYEKLHRVLVVSLRKCALFLIEELVNIGDGVACAFCLAALNEHAKSSMKDDLFKVARRICSSLFLLEDDKHSITTEILTSLLDSLAQKCTVEGEHWRIEFFDLVSYLASKCQTASTRISSSLGKHLKGLAGHFSEDMIPIDLILRLYATALSLNDSAVNSRADDNASFNDAKEEHAIGFWIDQSILSDLAPVLRSLQTYFYGKRKETSVSSMLEFNNSPSHACSQLDCHYGTSASFMQKDRKVYLHAYLNALKFLCQPLAEMVNAYDKHIVAEGANAVFSTVLSSVQDAFHHFCYAFLYFHGTVSGGDEIEQNKLIVIVAVAAFAVSIRTNFKLKKSMHLIKHIISSEWIQPQCVKDIFSRLYNVGVRLYRRKQTTEASKAFILCCKALWTHVLLLCQNFKQKSIGSGSDLSEDAILDFVTEASTETASLLDVVFQCNSLKVKKIIVNSLEKWAVAEDLFGGLTVPLPLVKQWVKIVRKLNKNMDLDDNSPTLYCLLSSPMRVSRKTIEKILEQELHVYEEMAAMSPELCQRMQMKIINILLNDVYTRDSHLQKSRILIRKGRLLRASGNKSLVGCIQCLSEAISLISDETCSGGSAICHQLAVAYCLRALCTQEAEPHSKQVFEDIRAALDLWLKIPVLDCDLVNEESSRLPDHMLVLLYSIIDLLSLKGTVQFHSDIYMLLIRVFKWKNLQLEKCLFMLWENRRLSHALCVSPVNDALISSLLRNFGEHFKSLDSWINCLKGSRPSLVGFHQTFSYLFTNNCRSSCNHETSFPSETPVDNIKEAAFNLLSCVPVTSSSVCIAGYLYYDMCERLIAGGYLFEALSYAKEAHRLRTKLFQEKLVYSVEKKAEKCTGNEDQFNGKLLVYESIACEVWSFDTNLLDMEACYLSPWKVLQCYLESTLQVGVILETIGNGVEAESFLLLGKDISCSQGLPLFVAAFSSALGKLYRKKHNWALAEKELQSTKHVLSHKNTASCLKCRLMLEVNLDMGLGDLSRSRFYNTIGNVSMEELFHAESLYQSALEKLNLSEWKNRITCPERVEHGMQNAFDTQGHTVSSVSTKGEKDIGKSRRSRNASRSLIKEQSSLAMNNTRVTRSRSRSSQNQNVSRSSEVQLSNSRNNGRDINDRLDTISEGMPFDVKSSSVELRCGVACNCNKMPSWFCLATEVMESGLMSNFVYMKWEFARRQLSLKVLAGIGKCQDTHCEIHEIHGTTLQSISVLVSRNPFVWENDPLASLLISVGKELPCDVFAVERAALIYRICWFALKSSSSKYTGAACCVLSHVPLQQIVSWLKLAFVRCREVPTLFQKVSTLLSAIYILASSDGNFSLPFHGRGLSESQWASYFHQASLGTHLNYQFFSNMIAKCKAQSLVDDKSSDMTGTAHVGLETRDLPRLAPESPQELENFIESFFADLPCSTVICISFIGGSLAKLLQELLLYPSSVGAWMVLSRLNFKSQPVVMLLPVDSVLEEAPWPHLTVLMSLGCPKLGADFLNAYLMSWTRKMEDSWFGPWRFVLLGERSNSVHLDSVQKKLVHDLKAKCKMDVNGSLLTLILEGAGRGLDRDVFYSQLLSLKKGCFIGEAGYSGKEKSEIMLNKSEEAIKQSVLAVQLISEAVSELEEEMSVTRGPVILVLDCEVQSPIQYDLAALWFVLPDAIDNPVQMLPWENLPTLRNQEVYRMPSVCSINSMLNKSSEHQKHGLRLGAPFPLIDPLDAFYLLNPSGDLSRTQVEFQNWFEDQNLEGKAGSAPSAEELALALKSHDLFIYLGHGSGMDPYFISSFCVVYYDFVSSCSLKYNVDSSYGLQCPGGTGVQYISRREIQKLDNCAATLLMGCSSGSLYLNGCYLPEGTALSYLQAGSPAIVANLWEVTDKDIDRFARAILDASLKARSSASLDCSQCNLLAKEFETLNIKGGKGNAKKKAQRKKAPEEEEDSNSASNKSCDHRPRLGSFMGQAREACTLPFLIGAAPVCYGVPTGIRRKDL
ncbi:hypothetical protein Tsubulata_046816 [Turnera subulata]|uniref:separase n=1 Tax=Turnera subulata TaxID=218843 RepID=A0A9Q0FSQ0_9ROSI|nr:hypothetical protein Tsubulata_046816 [Turnera subulata]